MRQVSAEDLILCPDTTTNQAMIEYEDWLQNSISALEEPLIPKGHHSLKQKQLIEELSLATEELRAAKREEWSRQLAAMPSQVPLPPFVIDNQCSIVDGGQSPFSASFDKRGVETPFRKISLCWWPTYGPYCALLLPRTRHLLPRHECLYHTL